MVTENIQELPPIVIIRLRNMTALDATGLFALEEVARELHASKRTLILCGARAQPARLMRQAAFEEVVGLENICEHVQAALVRAEEVFEEKQALAAGKVSTGRTVPLPIQTTSPSRTPRRP
jgi:SulP family sulfate permease